MTFLKLKQLIENLDNEQIYQTVDVIDESGKRHKVTYVGVDEESGEVVLHVD